MIAALDTSTPTCRLWLDGTAYEWEAGRTLAKGLLKYLSECLSASEAAFDDLSGLVVFRGPGSFTGLRIGITVFNTIAYANGIPVVGETGDDWREKGLARLEARQDDRIVVPEYGSEAHITLPKG